MKLSAAQRRVLQQHRIYSFNVNKRTLDSLIERGLVETLTEKVDGYWLAYAGTYIASKAGRAALAEGK